MKRVLQFPFLQLMVPAALVGALLLAEGCMVRQGRYYTLAEPIGIPDSAFLRDAGAPRFIEFEPVDMPRRLARPQIVVRRDASATELELLEKHRWSSSFDSELRDALAVGVAARLGAIYTDSGGRPAHEAAWRVAVRLNYFDVITSGRIKAAFSWTLARSDTGRPLTCQWSTHESFNGDIEVLAQGAQRVVTRAAETITKQIKLLQKDSASVCLG